MQMAAIASDEGCCFHLFVVVSFGPEFPDFRHNRNLLQRDAFGKLLLASTLKLEYMVDYGGAQRRTVIVRPTGVAERCSKGGLILNAF